MHERVESCIEIRGGLVAAKAYHRLSGLYAVGHCCVRPHWVISMHGKVESCIENSSRQGYGIFHGILEIKLLLPDHFVLALAGDDFVSLLRYRVEHLRNDDFKM